MELLHNNSHQWCCSKCKYRTTSSLFLRNHSRVHNFRNCDFNCTSAVLECYDCECGYQTFSTLSNKRHINLIHQKSAEHDRFKKVYVTKYKCKTCNFESSSFLIMYRHLLQTRCPKKLLRTYYCCECDYLTHHKYNVKNHVAKHKKCPSTMIGNVEIRQLMDESGKWFECGNCEFKANLRSKVKKHIIKNHIIKEIINCLKCNDCNYKTKDESNLKRHFAMKHVNIEDTWFIDTSAPKSTVSCHSVEYTSQNQSMFSCDVCDYKTRIKDCLRRHVMAKHTNHDEINWFKCNTCSYKAKWKADLKQHIEAKHTDCENINWLKCDHCHYKTRQGKGLRKHILLKHTKDENIKWHECSVCSYRAKLKTSLKSHIRSIHTKRENLNWFKCEFCDYNTKHNKSLKIHVLVKHTDNDSIDWFKCTSCDYKAKLKNLLKRHVNLKHGKPEDIQWFHCDSCEYKCKEKRQLKTHVSAKHVAN